MIGTLVSRLRQRGCACGATAFIVAFLSNASAYAVSERVQQACRDDYYQHCSQFSVGTDELRQCMRKVGENLSTPCLVALVQDGEITKAEVERHNAAKGDKSGSKKTTAEKKNAPDRKKATDKKTSTEIASKDADDPKEVSVKSAKKKKKKTLKTAENTDPAKEKAEKDAASTDKAVADA
ncbi:MAG: hypothetical protein ABUL43_03100, partial [Hyphomicrobium sp.]